MTGVHQKIRFGDHGRTLVPRRIQLLQVMNDPTDFPGADYQIHFRDFCKHLFPVSLGKTPGDNQFQLSSAFLFFFSKRQNDFQSLFLGRQNKTTGVDYDDIRLIGTFHQGHSRCSGLTAHDFRINEILRAAQRNDMQFSGGIIFHREAF
ncbi:MAG: hypothetical protein BWX99_02704 [Deltaproteobacteria bacterium ADurb.Bin151]|nr:MAG: hypothetical protein BWX99_02704 [Deltaproteobacteria bacterium ADurb.Bin151]